MQQICETYPRILVVPTAITDNTLKFAYKFRSKGRLPVLTYLHPVNNCTITRSSQPMTGIKLNRSIQDETLLKASSRRLIHLWSILLPMCASQLMHVRRKALACAAESPRGI